MLRARRRAKPGNPAEGEQRFVEMMNDKYEEEKHSLIKELEVLKQACSFVDQELHNFGVKEEPGSTE